MKTLFSLIGKEFVAFMLECVRKGMKVFKKLTCGKSSVSDTPVQAQHCSKEAKVITVQHKEARNIENEESERKATANQPARVVYYFSILF